MIVAFWNPESGRPFPDRLLFQHYFRSRIRIRALMHILQGNLIKRLNPILRDERLWLVITSRDNDNKNVYQRHGRTFEGSVSSRVLFC